MRTRILRFLAVPAAMAASLTAVSCGGGGGGTDMVLVGFNLPNIAGVPINQPLIYTFSDNVDPNSVTPDTLQVVGQPSFTFETIVVDGNLVAELPSVPTFDDYSDSGLAPNTTYTVFLPVFPAVDTIKSATGHPLVKAESFTFQTFPAPVFIEARRPLIHTPGPVTGGSGARGDEDGCLQNATNSLYDANNPFQAGTDAFARLLCLQNDGAPRVLLDECAPTHDQRAVGTPSALFEGTLDLGAIRIRFNEPLDPLTVTPASQTIAPNPLGPTPPTITKTLGLNVQLYRVAESDGIPIPFVNPSEIQVSTNIPVVIQDSGSTEVIIVPVGPQRQGIYAVNVKGLKDLAGNFLNPATRPNPATGGYGAIDTSLAGRIPIGYRYYFRTLQLPATEGSITEGFGNNFAEQTSGLFTFTTVPNQPSSAIVGSPAVAFTNAFTLIKTQPGQSTNANWNGTNRFLGLASLPLNSSVDNGVGRLKAVFKPYMGSGEDGVFNLPAGSATLSSDTGSIDNDGIFEFESFSLGAGATLTLTGSKPLLILVRGSCTIAGTLNGSGGAGRFGLDTDGTAKYTNPLGVSASGVGGVPGPGGGAGGYGAPNWPGAAADGTGGSPGVNLFGESSVAGNAGRGASGDNTNQGGGGGGYGTAGSGGTGAVNGGVVGEATFARALTAFVPERCHQPNANVAGGAGGGGGGFEDDNGASETGDSGMISFLLAGGQVTSGDDAGAGGGGGGGALWIIGDTITVASTGVIRCDGGRGGCAYAAADQVVFDPNPDMNVTGDEYVTGVLNDGVAGTGAGGGGGGGAGGAILLQARTSLAVQASATLSAVGGAAGTAASKTGGLGGSGRIGLMGFAASSDDAVSATVTVDGAAAISPAVGVQGQLWKPSTDLTSQGVSQWINLVTSTTTFGVPFWDDNTVTLTGGGLTTPADFSITLEFQAADTLAPDAVNPTSGTGLTAWSVNPSTLNNKLFFRWRFRFFVAKTFNQATFPMPQVLNITIPFQK